MGLDSAQRDRAARREQRRPDGQDPLRRPALQRERRPRAGPAQQRDDQPADQMAAEPEQLGGVRWPEGEVKPAQRPAGHDDRDQREQVGAQSGRYAQPGGQRGGRTGPPGRGLRHYRDGQRGRRDPGQQQHVDEPGRRGRELHQGAAAQGADGQPADRRHAVDQPGPAGCVRRVQVDEGRAQRGHGGAGGYPLDQPGQQQDGDVTRGQEEDQRHRLQRDRYREDRAPAQVIRQRPEHEQRGDQPERVHGEDRGQDGRGKAPLVLVDDIQRRRGAGDRGEQHEDRAYRAERGRAGQPGGSGRRLAALT